MLGLEDLSESDMRRLQRTFTALAKMGATPGELDDAQKGLAKVEEGVQEAKAGISRTIEPGPVGGHDLGEDRTIFEDRVVSASRVCNELQRRIVICLKASMVVPQSAARQVLQFLGPRNWLADAMRRPPTTELRATLVSPLNHCCKSGVAGP